MREVHKELAQPEKYVIFIPIEVHRKSTRKQLRAREGKLIKDHKMIRYGLNKRQEKVRVLSLTHSIMLS